MKESLESDVVRQLIKAINRTPNETRLHEILRYPFPNREGRLNFDFMLELLEDRQKRLDRLLGALKTFGINHIDVIEKEEARRRIDGG